MAVIALAALGGCGPKIDEIGVAVLVAAPFVYLSVHFFLYLLSLLWRRRYPLLRHPLKLWLIIPAVVLAIAAPFIGPSRKLDLAVMAYWVFGTSYLTVTLVVWRLWFIANEELAFTHAQIPVAALYTMFGLACVAKARDLAQLGVMAFIFPGYGGLISAPLYIALIIEAAVRGKRHPQPLARPPS